MLFRSRTNRIITPLNAIPIKSSTIQPLCQPLRAGRGYTGVLAPLSLIAIRAAALHSIPSGKCSKAYSVPAFSRIAGACRRAYVCNRYPASDSTRALSQVLATKREAPTRVGWGHVRPVRSGCLQELGAQALCHTPTSRQRRTGWSKGAPEGPFMIRRRALRTAALGSFRGTVAPYGPRILPRLPAAASKRRLRLRGVCDWLGLLARLHLGPDGHDLE